MRKSCFLKHFRAVRPQIHAGLSLAILALSAEQAGAAGLNQEVHFNIAPQPLAAALMEFSDQADVQLIMADTSLAGLQCAGVSGVLPVEKALRELLRGTPMDFKPAGQDTITLVRVAATVEQPIRLAQAEEPRTVTTPAPSSEPIELQEVQVTGSRIIRRDLEAASPLVTVEEQAINESSTIGVETVLNQLPQFVPANTQFVVNDIQPSPTNTPGAATLNLRGLGSNRTLVLIDGRRGQPSNASLVIDANTIPSAAIQSVEIISGGASAVYGADAMGGVTNFKLRDNFEGASFEVRSSITEAGDGEETRLSGLLGVNLSGRGNAMLSMEWTKREVALRRERDFYADAFTDPGVNATSTRLNFVSYEPTSVRVGGQTRGLPAQDVVNSLFPEKPADLTNVPNNSPFYVNTDGTLFKSSNNGLGFNGPLGERYKIGPTGILGENDLDAWLSSPLERHSLFGRAHYELGRGVSAFSQVMFVSTEVDSRQQPSPATGNWGAMIPTGDTIYAPSVDPETGLTRPEYLPGGAYGLNCPPTGGCTKSQAFPIPPELEMLLQSRGPNVLSTTQFDPNTGQPLVIAGEDADWRLGRTLDFMPPRSTNNTTQLYQLLAGFEGDLGLGDWTWEAYISHGETKTDTNFIGFASTAHYLAIATAPNYGRGLVREGLGGKTLRCTSGLPMFEQFEVSQDCLDSIQVNAADRMRLTQDIVEANFQGGIMQLPAGELRGALGLSYRENVFTFTPDPLRNIAGALDTMVGTFGNMALHGETNVKEAYAELLIPLLRDKPFIQSLELELGGRYSKYNTGAGGVPTYKGLFSWAPTEYLRFRGGYQLANRAPNINELFLGPSISVVQAGIDPCNAFGTTVPWGNSPNNPNRAQVQALCSAIIGSGTSTFDTDPDNYISVGGTTSIEERRGNPDLESEEGRTYTLGFVLRSPFEHPAARGFTLAVDYYRAKIEDAISQVGAQTTYDLCFNRDGMSNPTYSIDDPNGVCRRIIRDPISGAREKVDAPYANIGTIETSGVDVQANWRSRFEDIGLPMIPGALSLSVSFNKLISFKAQEFPTQPAVEYKGTFNEGGQYRYRAVTTLRYNVGPANVALNWRHLPSIENSRYALDPNTQFRGSVAYDILNLSGGYEINQNISISGGIDNLFDKDPPRYGAWQESNAAGVTLSGYYNTLGRSYYARVRMNF